MSLPFLSSVQQDQLQVFEALSQREKRTQAGLAQFNAFLFDYFKAQGRVLPWRSTVEPYTTFISEVMLQQTQVDRVIDKYKMFIQEFPSFETLAKASPAAVLAQWQGLGYNRRALFLQRAAQKVVQEFEGCLPKDPEDLISLPGIGPATAASIAAFAFNQPTVFLETNIKSVFIYFFFPRTKVVTDEALLSVVKKAVPAENARDWYSALMDFGTQLKKEVGNQTRKSKTYQKQSAFQGSDRQIRGKILRLLLKTTTMTFEEVITSLNEPGERVVRILEGMTRDGLVVLKYEQYSLPH